MRVVKDLHKYALPPTYKNKLCICNERRMHARIVLKNHDEMIKKANIMYFEHHSEMKVCSILNMKKDLYK